MFVGDDHDVPEPFVAFKDLRGELLCKRRPVLEYFLIFVAGPDAIGLVARRGVGNWGLCTK